MGYVILLKASNDGQIPELILYDVLMHTQNMI